MGEITPYVIYWWDCPECGAPNEYGDIEPSGDCECDSCGATVEVG